LKYWLLKSEANCFSIDDLAERPKKTEPWDGVRNYQARNMMRDDMKVGDLVFFYHSNCDTPGIVGVATIVSEGYPDPTAFNPNEKHYDPKSDPDNPRWYLVDVKLERKFNRTISLQEMRDNPLLENMILLRKGNRLSVMPIEKKHWDVVLSLE